MKGQIAGGVGPKSSTANWWLKSSLSQTERNGNITHLVHSPIAAWTSHDDRQSSSVVEDTSHSEFASSPQSRANTQNRSSPPSEMQYFRNPQPNQGRPCHEIVSHRMFPTAFGTVFQFFSKLIYLAENKTSNSAPADILFCCQFGLRCDQNVLSDLHHEARCNYSSDHRGNRSALSWFYFCTANVPPEWKQFERDSAQNRHSCTIRRVFEIRKSENVCTHLSMSDAFSGLINRPCFSFFGHVQSLDYDFFFFFLYFFLLLIKWHNNGRRVS